MTRRTQGRPTPQQALAVAKEPFIDELVGACATARNALGQPDPERDRQVEDAFFRAAAALETFLTEWLVRCLSFDSSVFQATYEERAANEAVSQLESGWDPSARLWKDRGAAVAVTVDLPIHKKNSLEVTRALLGALDDNLTIRGTEDLVTLANDYLAERYARRTKKLGRQRAAVLNATTAIRNVLAHRSKRSTDRMNERLGSKKLPEELRRGARSISASGVGYHLQASRGGQPRFERYFEELAEVGHTLAPTKGRKKKICP